MILAKYRYEYATRPMVQGQGVVARFAVGFVLGAVFSLAAVIVLLGLLQLAQGSAITDLADLPDTADEPAPWVPLPLPEPAYDTAVVNAPQSDVYQSGGLIGYYDPADPRLYGCWGCVEWTPAGTGGAVPEVRGGAWIILTVLFGVALGYRSHKAEGRKPKMDTNTLIWSEQQQTAFKGKITNQCGKLDSAGRESKLREICAHETEYLTKRLYETGLAILGETAVKTEATASH